LAQCQENGGWDPIDLWNVDTRIAHDMLTVLQFLHDHHSYPPELSFEKQIEAVWKEWRGARV